MTVDGLLMLYSGPFLVGLAMITHVSRRMRGGVFCGCWLVAIGGLIMSIATGPLFHTMSLWALASYARSRSLSARVNPAGA